MDDRDLINMLRHAYLMGAGSHVKEAFESNKEDEWVRERDEAIEDLISDYKEDGFICYNDDCGSVEHPSI